VRCQGCLTPRTLDAISSLGERLSVPLVAAACKGQGIASEAIEATELVVTDCSHGAADALLDLTRERCESRLRPLLKKASFGRHRVYRCDGRWRIDNSRLGRFHYSTTILGAVFDADEGLILTDVDGLLTADPPKMPGTKITATGAPSGCGVTALTSVSDGALITVAGPRIAVVPNVSGRTFVTTRELRIRRIASRE